jgi:hypothetical protein
MFAKWLKQYQKLSEKSRFVSKLSAFLLSICLLLSLYDLGYFFYHDPQHLRTLLNEQSKLLSSVIFQVLIFIVFASRFVLLFFQTIRVFWLNQFLWLIGMILLTSYWFASRPSYDGFDFRFYETYTSVFAFSSKSFDFLGLWYLLLSPVRQFVTFVVALIKDK